MFESFKKPTPNVETKEVELTPEDEALIKRVMEASPAPAQSARETTSTEVDELLHPARTDEEVRGFAQAGINPHGFSVIESGHAVTVEDEEKPLDKAA